MANVKNETSPETMKKRRGRPPGSKTKKDNAPQKTEVLVTKKEVNKIIDDKFADIKKQLESHLENAFKSSDNVIDVKAIVAEPQFAVVNGNKIQLLARSIVEVNANGSYTPVERGGVRWSATLQPGKQYKVRLGFTLSGPSGTEAVALSDTQLSLAGLSLFDTPQTVSQYNSGTEMSVIICNTAKHNFTIKAGQRVGDLLVQYKTTVNVEIESQTS